MPHMDMTHDVDPKKTLLDALGNIDDYKVFHNEIIVAVYIRPEKTKSGIYLPDSHRDEDRHQSKVGLVVKKGPIAFVDDDRTNFNGQNVELNDWIVFRASDGWSLNVNGVLCRMLQDTNIRMAVPSPDVVF